MTEQTDQNNVVPLRKPLEGVFDHDGTPLAAGDTILFLDTAKKEVRGAKAIVCENQEIPLGNRLVAAFEPQIRCRLVDTGEEGVILMDDVQKVTTH